MQRYEIGTKNQLLLKTDMAKMNFTPADDLVDEVWGKIGTPERDAMETKLQKEIEVYHKKQKDSDIEPQTTEIVLPGVTK